MMQTEYIRDGNTIRSVEKKEDGGPKDTFIFPSISKAKKESRRLQIGKNGSLGNGYVMLLVKEKKKGPKPGHKSFRANQKKKALGLTTRTRYKKKVDE